MQALRQRLLEGRSSNLKDGAVLVADNRSGEVLSYVGNGGSLSSAPFVDGVRALRQAGSTLKPFLYARALERRLITAASLLDDSPLDIAVEGGLYRPGNYDDRFRGPVTVREALASSLNIPAVRLLNLVGVDDFLSTLRNFGFRELHRPDHYGPSLALGSADISLWDLVNAYRTIANLGRQSPLRLQAAADQPRHTRVLGGEAAFLIAMILSDRESRSLTFGLESPLSTRYWSAVKTGTSKDMRDNWCVGFSQHYTVGVWVGNFSGEPMWSVSGMTGAAPVWVDVMNWLHRNESSQPPQPPPQVVRGMVRSQNRPRVEWFLAGTEQSESIPFRTPGQPRILYPPSQALIALDPDIPDDNQRLFLESAPSRPGTYWRLNSEILAAASRPVPWEPTAGRHLLELIDGENQVLDSITFEVRGATTSGR